MSDAVLLVNGRAFDGWETVTVRRSVEAVAGTFELKVTDRWADLSEPWPLFAGDACTLRLGAETVISGYIDETRTSISGDSHEMSVTGRDRTQDVVDCSAEPKEYRNNRLEMIATDQCAKVGVGVSVQAATGEPIPKFATQPGETILEALARAAKGKRVLLTSTATGDLAITKAGIDRVGVTLKEGVNILECSATTSTKDRFTKYVVLGQVDGDTGGSSTEATWGVRGEATDKFTNRNRTLVIIADDKATAKYVKDRAAWEAKTRAGKASVVTVKVQGWTKPDGLLWRPNSIVTVESPSNRISGDLVIAEIEYSLGDDGTTTTMTLRRKDAYTDDVDIPPEMDPVKRDETDASVQRKLDAAMKGRK